MSSFHFSYFTFHSSPATSGELSVAAIAARMEVLK
jgi:hypothetical protein